MVAGCSDRAENEERLLLDRAGRIDPDSRVEVRERQLEELEALPLQTAELESLRDTCVRGHRSLVRAEVQQGVARTTLEELTGAAGEDGSAAKAAEIEAAITESNEALGEARDLLRRCEEELAALRHRHDGR